PYGVPFSLLHPRTSVIYHLSLHDALPILPTAGSWPLLYLVRPAWRRSNCSILHAIFCRTPILCYCLRYWTSFAAVVTRKWGRLFYPRWKGSVSASKAVSDKNCWSSWS